VKVSYINDTVESYNWGAIAASSGLKKLIKDAEGEIGVNFHQSQIKNFRFSGTIQNGNMNGHHSAGKYLDLITPPAIPKVYNRLRKAAGFQEEPEISSVWDQFKQFAEDCLTKKNTLSGHFQRMEHTDVTVINGEGCIFGNKFLSKMIFALGYISGSILQKPTVIVNHTADYSDPELLSLAKKVYPLFDDVVVREYASLKGCQEYCDVRFAADTSYCYEPYQKEYFLKEYALAKERLDTTIIEEYDYSFNPEKPYICLGGSSLLCKYSDSAAVGYIELINELKTLPVQLVLTASAPPDQKLFKSLSKQLRLPLIGFKTPVSLAISILGHAEVYIGGRWHPGNMAMSGGTPVIPFSANTFKMNALADMQGLSSTVFDIQELHHHKVEILELTKKYLHEGKTVRNKIYSLSDSLRGNVRNNVGFLENWLYSEKNPQQIRAYPG
jgi:hypothetical protein